VFLDAPHPTVRKPPLHQPAENASQPHIDIQDPEHLATVFTADFEGDVGDADYLTALSIDDLLIQQIADGAEHVFVGMIGGEILVAQPNSVERDRANLVVTDGEPGGAAADQKAVEPDRIDQGNEGGIPDHTNPAVFEVKDLEAEQFGKEQDLFRHRGAGDMDLERTL